MERHRSNPKFFDKRGNYNLKQWHQQLLKTSSYNKEIILICRSGRRTKLAADIVSKNLGINVYNVTNGIKLWIQSNEPLLKP